MEHSLGPCGGIQRLWIILLVLVLSATASSQTASRYDELVHQGNAQLQAGSNDLAFSSANSAIQLNAKRWEAYALAGGALMNLKHYEEAADNFSEAIQLAPVTKQQSLRDLRRQCFVAGTGPSPATALPPQPGAMQAEIVLWKSIENSSNADDFKTYLQSYPKGAFAALARRHLDELQAQADRDRQMRQEQEEREEARRAQELASTFAVTHYVVGIGSNFRNGSLMLVSGGIEYRSSADRGFRASCSDVKNLEISKHYDRHPAELSAQGKKYVFYSDVSSSELLQRIAEHCGVPFSP